MIREMNNIPVGVFGHPEITYVMYIYLRIKYTERILRGTELKKFRHVLVECKESDKGLSGNQWSVGSEKSISMEQLWTWAKMDYINGTGETISGAEMCTYFDKELW